MATQSLALFADGKKFFVRDPSSDFHCQFGFVKAAELIKAKAGGIVKTNMGKELRVVPAGFVDYYGKIKRSAQIIPIKDVGSIITETGINSSSKVVDAGAGSGSLAILMANIVKEVVTYEIRNDFIKIVKKNISDFGIKNLKIKKKDISLGITEKNVDLITLDIPDPWKALPNAAKALKPGGFIVSYSPTLPQVSDFAEAVDKNKSLARIKTIEIIEREWDVEGRKLRPKSQPIGHSGFLTFVRKIGR